MTNFAEYSLNKTSEITINFVNLYFFNTKLFDTILVKTRWVLLQYRLYHAKPLL